jgi:hypothetical protein
MPRTRTKIEDFAEELGRLLGTAEAKARDWIEQRDQIAKSLAGIRDSATKLLADLGHEAQRVVRRGRTVARRATAEASSPRRRRRMSAAQRRAIRERMKRYWAERRAARKK